MIKADKVYYIFGEIQEEDFKTRTHPKGDVGSRTQDTGKNRTGLTIRTVRTIPNADRNEDLRDSSFHSE
ncbi:MAG: hypothetical protein BWY02_02887 [bacterium ADurb.Bin157]|nr:MAG: hypothetical protein BWY02_02887 [bacterium ADurb.Bin157]